jgi:hypothetical protein
MNDNTILAIYFGFLNMLCVRNCLYVPQYLCFYMVFGIVVTTCLLKIGSQRF